jgi:hypothetical protein
MIVKRVRLQKVDYVKSISSACDSVRYSKVVPLSESACVVVWFKYQIIFKLIDLNCASKIS